MKRLSQVLKHLKMFRVFKSITTISPQSVQVRNLKKATFSQKTLDGLLNNYDVATL